MRKIPLFLSQIVWRVLVQPLGGGVCGGCCFDAGFGFGSGPVVVLVVGG